MKKLCTVLSVIVCLSLLGGCSNDTTSSDASSNIIPDSMESAVENITSGTSSTTEAQVTDSTTSTGKATNAQNSTSSTAKATTTTTTTKASPSSTPAAPQAPQNSSKYITGISINKLPNKTTYITGDKLESAGLVINRLYSDGSSDKIDKDFTVMGFSSKTPGKKTLTVVYKHENGSTLLCNYDVTITKKQHGTPDIPQNFHHDLENEVLRLTNEARAKAGLGALTMDTGKLMKAADIRAMEHVIVNAHERPDHDKWDTVYDEEDTGYKSRAENLGNNPLPTDGSSVAQGIFDAWMNSKEGHRENIMNPLYTHISIACLEYNGTYYWVQLFGGK